MNIREQFEKEKCGECEIKYKNSIGTNVGCNFSQCYAKYLEQDREKLLNQLDLKEQQNKQMQETLLNIKEALHDDCFADAEMYVSVALEKSITKQSEEK